MTSRSRTIAAVSERSRITRFVVFAGIGMALGFALSWLATLSSRPIFVWLGLSARLVLFAVVVAGLARSYGPAAGLCVLITAVLTRGLIARNNVTAAR